MRSAVTIVSWSPAGSALVALNDARCGDTELWHALVDPIGPSKQSTVVNASNAVWTVAVTTRIGTSQAPPLTFQKSSSWSAKLLSAPRTL